MTRYAVRRTSDGAWRSARRVSSFGEWSSAQLWENAKTAEQEVKRWAKHDRWSRDDSGQYIRLPDPVTCEVVAINIPEPR